MQTSNSFHEQTLISVYSGTFFAIFFVKGADCPLLILPFVQFSSLRWPFFADR